MLCCAVVLALVALVAGQACTSSASKCTVNSSPGFCSNNECIALDAYTCTTLNIACPIVAADGQSFTPGVCLEDSSEGIKCKALPDGVSFCTKVNEPCFYRNHYNGTCRYDGGPQTDLVARWPSLSSHGSLYCRPKHATHTAVANGAVTSTNCASATVFATTARWPICASNPYGLCTTQCAQQSGWRRGCSRFTCQSTTLSVFTALADGIPPAGASALCSAGRWLRPCRTPFGVTGACNLVGGKYFCELGYTKYPALNINFQPQTLTLPPNTTTAFNGTATSTASFNGTTIFRSSGNMTSTTSTPLMTTVTTTEMTFSAALSRCQPGDDCTNGNGQPGICKSDFSCLAIGGAIATPAPLKKIGCTPKRLCFIRQDQGVCSDDGECIIGAEEEESPSSQAATSQGDGGGSTAGIVIGVLVAVLCVALVLAAAFWMLRRKKEADTPNQGQQMTVKQSFYGSVEDIAPAETMELSRDDAGASLHNQFQTAELNEPSLGLYESARFADPPPWKDMNVMYGTLQDSNDVSYGTLDLQQATTTAPTNQQEFVQQADQPFQQQNEYLQPHEQFGTTQFQTMQFQTMQPQQDQQQQQYQSGTMRASQHHQTFHTLTLPRGQFDPSSHNGTYDAATNQHAMGDTRSLPAVPASDRAAAPLPKAAYQPVSHGRKRGKSRKLKVEAYGPLMEQ